MDHPLIRKDSFDLRQRVIQLLHQGYLVRREGNIIFVCGGNESDHMRHRFKAYCDISAQNLEIFFPEFAMADYFSQTSPGPFDIAEFEELIADLSHAIVIFPEAAGSFAETGYFSATAKLSEKTILVLDAAHQGHDSFISLGPTRKFNQNSKFSDVLQIFYDNPLFENIVARIERFKLSKYKKTLTITNYLGLSNYERFCLIHKCFDILSIATIDDVVFILRGIFHSHLSLKNVYQLTSILVGAGYLIEVGSFGHYHPDSTKGDLLEQRSGTPSKEADIRLELANLYSQEPADFKIILEASRNVA